MELAQTDRRHFDSFHFTSALGDSPTRNESQLPASTKPRSFQGRLLGGFLNVKLYYLPSITLPPYGLGGRRILMRLPTSKQRAVTPIHIHKKKKPGGEGEDVSE
jgi:hypothetical protein